MRAVAALLLVAAPAAAEEATTELRPLCASRPGLGTPPCVLDKGHLQVEIGIFSTQRDLEADVGTSIEALLSTEVFWGIDGVNQVSLVLAPFNTFTVTDQQSGDRDRATGVGDMALRWRHSLRNPDGSGFSVAVEALLNLAIGNNRVRTNGWGAGLLVPASLALNDKWSLIAAPGFVWSQNLTSPGQHFDYTGSFGVTRSAGAFNITLEGGYTRDGEPNSGEESATMAVSLAWQPPHNADFQLDAGFSWALNPAAPDLQAYFGFVQRF